MTRNDERAGGAFGPLQHPRFRGPRALGLLTALLLVPLVLGLASASGSTLSVSTVTVQVIGRGSVTSTPAGLDCGNGAVTCHIAFSGSGVATLTPTAPDAWAFDSWTGCPTVTAEKTCEIPVDGSAATVFANFAGPPVAMSTLSTSFTGDGNVSGGEIDCGSSPAGSKCSWAVLTGSTLTVRQTPAPDSVFTGWGGACAGTGVACTVELAADRAVSAGWASSTGVLLTVSVSGAGSVSGVGIACPTTCSATQAVNSSVVLTARADEGNAFTGWGGACSGTTSTCVVLMSEAKSVTATFAPTVELRVSVSGAGSVTGGGGQINCGSNGETCSASLPIGSSITLTAVPEKGAALGGWSGACGGAATSCVVVMNGSKSVAAKFVTNTAQLTVRVTGAGRVSGGGINCGNGGTTCTANEVVDADVTLTATPASGSTFTGWSGACTDTTSTCIVSMTSAKTVSAAFSGAPTTAPTLTVSVTGLGTVSGGGISCGNGATACTLRPAPGATVALSAAPASGATFTGWSGACSGILAGCTVTMDSSKTVGATFTGGDVGAPTVVLAVTGPGSVSSYAGTCDSKGPKKTCTQQFGAGEKVVFTASAVAPATFKGWGGVCSGTNTTCTVTLKKASTLTAMFSAPLAPPTTVVLTSMGPPRVARVGTTGFRVSLRFRTTRAGPATVRGLLGGRAVATRTQRVAAGRRVITLSVARSGSYTFEIRLSGQTLKWRTCVGSCTR